MSKCLAEYIEASCDEQGTCRRKRDRKYFNCTESLDCITMIREGFGGSCLEANCTQYNLKTPTTCHEEILSKCTQQYGNDFTSLVKCFRSRSKSCPEPEPEHKPQPQRKPKPPAQCDTKFVCQRNDDEVYFNCSNINATACVKDVTTPGGDPSCLETACTNKTPSGPIPYGSNCEQRVQEDCEENCEPYGDYDTELNCNLQCLVANLTSCKSTSNVLREGGDSRKYNKAISRLTVGTSIVVTIGALVLLGAAGGWMYRKGLCCCMADDAPVVVDLSEEQPQNFRQSYLPIISEQA